MASNRIDPVHAVTAMALALVEIQKDIGSLQRQHSRLSEMVINIDSTLISKFASVDKALMFCLGKLKEQEVQDGVNPQGQEDINGNDEDVPEPEEGGAGVLRNDSGKETKRSGDEEQTESREVLSETISEEKQELLFPDAPEEDE